MTRMAVRFELEDLSMRPDPEPLLTEMIHAVSGTFLHCSFRYLMRIHQNVILFLSLTYLKM